MGQKEWTLGETMRGEPLSCLCLASSRGPRVTESSPWRRLLCPPLVALRVLILTSAAPATPFVCLVSIFPLLVFYEAISVNLYHLSYFWVAQSQHPNLVVPEAWQNRRISKQFGEEFGWEPIPVSSCPCRQQQASSSKESKCPRNVWWLYSKEVSFCVSSSPLHELPWWLSHPTSLERAEMICFIFPNQQVNVCIYLLFWRTQ